MHRPELLILDEPTQGLDPLVQQEFHKIVEEVRAEGRTVFLSSHVMRRSSVCATGSGSSGKVGSSPSRTSAT
jgi:ABC-type multidrug transport system ATPase subunit